MIYVFTFLGEFGFELLNWQGVIRRFAQTLDRPDAVVACGRTGLQPFYESAVHYVDISAVPLFRRSVACGYYAILPGPRGPRSPVNSLFEWAVRQQLRSVIRQALPAQLRAQDCRFVFSSQPVTLHGCRFGCDRQRFGCEREAGDIYELLDMQSNLFCKIEPDLSVRIQIEQRLGWSLETPFILCQTRKRSIGASSNPVPMERLIQPLARRIKTVLLEFSTGRQQDSYSTFADQADCQLYAAQSFTEQACLIHFARHCLFFTEGDFGSHIYVPPFLGRNVTAIAPRSVYALGTAPIEFWNRNVFRFGGAITAKTTEEIFANETSVQTILNELVPH